MLHFRRIVLAVCLAAAPVVMTACSMPKVSDEATPVLPPRPQAIDITPERLESTDYGIFLKILPDKTVRMPYEDERAALGALWPASTIGTNAAFFLAMAGAQMRNGDQAPAGSAFSDTRYEGDPEALDGWVSGNRFALGSFDMALTQTTCRLPVFIAEPGRGQAAPMPPMRLLRLIRFAAYLNEDRAFALELSKEPERAADAWMAGMKAGGLVQSEAIFIEQLIGGAILLTAGDGLARLMANAALPEAQLRRVLELARASEVTPAEMVGVYGRQCIVQRFLYTRGVGDSSRAWRALWRSAAKRQGGAEGLDVPERDVFMAVLPTAQAAVKRILNRPLERLVAGRDTVATLFGELAPGAGPAWIYYRQLAPVVTEWAGMVAQQNVEMRALQVRAAIELYERKHGGAPRALSDLTPDFLAKVPVDPFSGAPLKYARTADGWKLWSVGVDREDNGGVNASPDMPWNGPDAVFFSRRLSTEQLRSGYRHVLSGDSDRILEPGHGVPSKTSAK